MLTATRTNPQNLEAERALLGGMLLDNRKIPDVLSRIPPRALEFGARVNTANGERVDEPLFSNFANQEIFETILAIWREGHGVDLTTLGEQLDKQGRYEAVGGAPYLAGLEEEIVSTLYLPEYGRIVVEKWRGRSLVRRIESAYDAIQRSGKEPSEIAREAAASMIELAEGDSTDEPEDIEAIHAATVERIMREAEELRQRGGGYVGLPCGIRQIDNLTFGFRPGEQIVLGARPACGKSLMSAQWALAFARAGFATSVGTLEMDAKAVHERFIAAESGVDYGRIRARRIVDWEADKIMASTERFRALPLRMRFMPGATAAKISAWVRAEKMRNPRLAAIVLDYIQLVPGGGSKYESRQQALAKLSRDLKALAGQLGIVTIVCAQVNREADKRGQSKKLEHRMPRMSDLRECGDLEQDADIVFLLSKDNDRHYMQLAKGRNVASTPWDGTGSIKIALDGPRMEFVET